MLVALIGVEPAHFPGVDPGEKRIGLGAGSADAAAGKSFAGQRCVSARVTAACPIQTC